MPDDHYYEQRYYEKHGRMPDTPRDNAMAKAAEIAKNTSCTKRIQNELAAEYLRDNLPAMCDQPLEDPKEDLVNHPKHYTFGKFEVIDVLMDWFAKEPLLWQVGKYIARWDKKGDPLENLKKAQFYLNKKIEVLERLKG